MTLLDIDESLLEHATPEERAAYEEALSVEQALLSPLDFAERSLPGGIKRFPHTVLINQHIVAHTNHALYRSGIGLPAEWVPEYPDADDDSPLAQEGKWLHPVTGEEAVEILCVSMPPQHGKSYILTETAPAWFMARNPDKRVILTGYEANFAKGFSRKNREKIKEARIPGVELDPLTQAADDWAIKNHKGRVISAGAGGAITGKGADFIVIDDPIKNAKEALSDTARQTNWDWWTTTVKTRVQKDTVIIVIQTRWHEDDLIGRIVKNEKSHYYLNIPALAFDEADPVDGVAVDPDTGQRDPLGRRPGEPLCPELHTKAFLESRRAGSDETVDDEGLGGTLWFSCLYQGKPSVLGGGDLPGPYLRYTAKGAARHRVYTLTCKNGSTKQVKAKDLYRFITVDLAISEKNRADYSVFSLWGWTRQRDLILLDVWREKIQGPDHEKKAREFWKHAADNHGAVHFMGIEDKTFGSSLIQTLVRGGGIPVRPLTADVDKRTRALSFAGPAMAEGRVYFPHTPEAAEFIKECQAFPNGTHDDMADTLAYAGVCTQWLPRERKNPQPEPATASERAAQHIRDKLDAKTQGKRAGRHPTLGKW